MDDRRIFERIKAKITLRFSQTDNTKQSEAETVDISGEGIGFIAKESNLTANTPLKISLVVPDSREPLCLKDKVAWSSKLKGTNSQRIGVHLEEEKLMNIACALRSA